MSTHDMPLPDHDASLWRESYPHAPQYPQQTADISVDVVIVGAGITGLTTAYLLKQSGRTVAVLDKYTVGSGTTGRTTGKITSQHSLAYSMLIAQHGRQTAQIYGQANQTAVELVKSIVTRAAIDCDLRSEDNYVFTADPSQVETFKQEAADSASLGLPADFVTDSKLPFDISGAVRFREQATFNSQKYVLGLAKRVHGQGSYVFENTKAIDINYAKPTQVRTLMAKIRATDIVVATNVPTWPLMARGSYCVLEYPIESYLIAAKTTSTLSGMYISPDKDHYSILPTKFEGQNYLLIGGAGHFSARRVNRAKRFQQIAAYAERNFAITAITHQWSDRDYLAYDRIPLVGRAYPWSKHLYVGTAFKKWGLSNGTAAGMILSDLIQGKSNPWADTFTPLRIKPLFSWPATVLTGSSQ